MPINVSLLTVAASAGLATLAHAQWTVTNLHPSAGARSRAQGSADGRQGGYAFVGGVDHAIAWTGTSASAQDVHPAGASYSRIYNVARAASDAAADAVGVARFGFDHAAHWSGSTYTFVDLHPADGFSSVGYDTDGTQQVGIVYIGTPPGGLYHASLWTGTADSWVSLHPGSVSSFAYGCGDGMQVGYANFGGSFFNASLWHGTADSWVNLHPAAASDSVAYAVVGSPGAPGQQGGVAGINGVDHASIWSGTAESWVDLHPAGATESEVSGIGRAADGTFVQVGSALFGAVRRAGYWTGSAASWVDLSAALTGSWGDTEAESVWIDGGQMFVSGWGRNLTTNRDEALLWTGPAPTTGCDTIDFNQDGLFPDNFDLVDFLSVFAGGNCTGQPTGAPPCNADIDFNNDGLFPDNEDIFSFFRVFGGGDC